MVEFKANDATRALYAIFAERKDLGTNEFQPAKDGTAVVYIDAPRVTLAYSFLSGRLDEPIGIELDKLLRPTEWRKLEEIKLGANKAVFIFPNETIEFETMPALVLSYDVFDERIREFKPIRLDPKQLRQLDLFLQKAKRVHTEVILIDFVHGEFAFDYENGEFDNYQFYNCELNPHPTWTAVGVDYLLPAIHEIRMLNPRSVELYSFVQEDGPLVIKAHFADGSVLTVSIAPREISEDDKVVQFYKHEGHWPRGDELKKWGEKEFDQYLKEITQLENQLTKRLNEEARKRAEELRETLRNLSVLYSETLHNEQALKEWEQMTGKGLKEWYEWTRKQISTPFRRANELSETTISELFKRNNAGQTPTDWFVIQVHDFKRKPSDVFKELKEKLTEIVNSNLVSLNSAEATAVEKLLSTPGKTPTDKVKNVVMEYLRYKVPLCIGEYNKQNPHWFLRCVKLGQPEWWSGFTFATRQFWKWFDEQALKMAESTPKNAGEKIVHEKIDELRREIEKADLPERLKAKLMKDVQRLEDQLDYVLRREPDRLETILNSTTFLSVRSIREELRKLDEEWLAVRRKFNEFLANYGPEKFCEAIRSYDGTPSKAKAHTILLNHGIDLDEWPELWDKIKRFCMENSEQPHGSEEPMTGVQAWVQGVIDDAERILDSLRLIEDTSPEVVELKKKLARRIRGFITAIKKGKIGPDEAEDMLSAFEHEAVRIGQVARRTKERIWVEAEELRAELERARKLGLLRPAGKEFLERFLNWLKRTGRLEWIHEATTEAKKLRPDINEDVLVWKELVPLALNKEATKEELIKRARDWVEEIEVPVEVHGEKTEMSLEEVAEMEVPPEEEGLRFIRQKLRDAYVGKFLLHGFKEDEIKPPVELIDRLAREVYEGRLKQVKAMAEILRVAERDLAEAKKERALRKLGVRREPIPEDETYLRLLRSLERRLEAKGITIDYVLPEIEPELRELARAVEEDEVSFQDAVIKASRLAQAVYKPPREAPPIQIEIEKQAPKVKTTSEIAERREAFPEYVWEYTGKTPEWLKDALSNPREVGEMLFYGVERYLREKAEQFPGAEAYADFLAKWLGENVIYKTIKRLEAKGRNLREGLALYLLKNYSGVLVEGGMDALYKRAAGWAKYLLKTCPARECGFALKFATNHRVCYSAEDYHKVKVVREKEPGYTCEPGLYYLMMSAIVEALKTVGGSEADLPEPYRLGYEKFISKMVEEFSRR